MEDSETKEYKEKSKIFYSTIISVWFNTKLEKDKQLLILSTTAIGLLVTLLRTFSVSNNWELFCYVLALVCFVITIISVFVIFDRNASYIEKLIEDPRTEAEDLKTCDKVASTSFIIAIIAVLAIGIFGINSSTNQGEKLDNMSTEQNINRIDKSIILNPEQKHSFSGANKLSPRPPKNSGGNPGSSDSSGSVSKSKTDNK